MRTGEPSVETRLGTLFAALLDEGRLRCPRCDGTGLTVVDGGVACTGCDTLYPEHTKVVDFYNRYRPDPAAGRAPWSRRRQAEVIDRLTARLDLPTGEDARRQIGGILERAFRRAETAALSAEIRDVLDRFEIDGGLWESPTVARLGLAARHLVRPPNRGLAVSFERHYLDGELEAGATSWHNVRVRNEGRAPWSSAVRRPLYLSYRWLGPTGARLDIEGVRTAFPIDIDPGRAVTVPVRVVAPPDPGAYVLQVQLVHEDVRWLDDPVLRMPVQVVSGPPAPRWPTGLLEERPRDLDYATDHRVAFDFVRAYLAEHPADVRRVLEVGGGTSPQAAFFGDHQVVNIDIGSPLLELGALHYGAVYDERLCFLCADALDPPFVDGSFDAVVMFATLHHFPDPEALLDRCRRLLAPGGFVGVMCEPAGHDLSGPPTVRDLLKGINEQVFSVDEYLGIAAAAGLTPVRGRVDGGSLKVILRPTSAR